jgi:Flp pilus assembly pilin Flp
MWLQAVMYYFNVVLLRFATVSRRLGSAQAGQSMVEYAIVAALIAIVAMAAVQALGGGIAQVFTNILNRITGIGG